MVVQQAADAKRVLRRQGLAHALYSVVTDGWVQEAADARRSLERQASAEAGMVLRAGAGARGTKRPASPPKTEPRISTATGKPGTLQAMQL